MMPAALIIKKEHVSVGMYCMYVHVRTCFRRRPLLVIKRFVSSREQQTQLADDLRLKKKMRPYYRRYIQYELTFMLVVTTLVRLLV